MQGRRVLGLILVLSAASGASAIGAASTSYIAHETVFDLGIDGSDVTLPDLTQGGTVTLTAFALQNNPQYVTNPIANGPVAGSFGFILEPASGSVGPGSMAGLDVSGQYTGSIYGTPSGSPPRASGELSGVVTQASLFTGGITADPSNVPEPLLALINQPSRMTISSEEYVSGGETVVYVSLKIAPATAPEPSTLVILATTLAGVVIVRTRRRVR